MNEDEGVGVEVQADAQEELPAGEERPVEERLTAERLGEGRPPSP